MIFVAIASAITMQQVCVAPTAPLVPESISTAPEEKALRRERMIYVSNSSDYIECELEAMDTEVLTDLQRASRQAALNQFFDTREAYTDGVEAVLDAYAAN